MRVNCRVKETEKQGVSPGNIGDVLTVGIFLISMTMLLISYFHSVKLIETKAAVGQLSRQYILQMETTGYLTGEDEAALRRELEALAVTEIHLGNTTTSQVRYGAPILLEITGKLDGIYEFKETRSSTAKH